MAHNKTHVPFNLQVALESALAQFPKGSAERWERIAGKVPGKSKEQCMLRFRDLPHVTYSNFPASPGIPTLVCILSDKYSQPSLSHIILDRSYLHVGENVICGRSSSGISPRSFGRGRRGITMRLPPSSEDCETDVE